MVTREWDRPAGIRRQQTLGAAGSSFVKSGTWSDIHNPLWTLGEWMGDGRAEAPGPAVSSRDQEQEVQRGKDQIGEGGDWGSGSQPLGLGLFVGVALPEVPVGVGSAAGVGSLWGWALLGGGVPVGSLI